VEKIAITPSGVSLRDVNEKNMVIVGADGEKLEGDEKPSSEFLMHLKIYEQRKDVNAVVHTHSAVATGFAFAGEKIKRLEGFGPIENPFIPMVEYYAPGTAELAQSVSNALKNEDIVLLKKHGVVACGDNLDTASLLAGFVEETAKIQFVSRLLSHEQTQAHLKHSI
jgi:L-fuculose-phosphate aldolase